MRRWCSSATSGWAEGTLGIQDTSLTSKRSFVFVSSRNLPCSPSAYVCVPHPLGFYVAVAFFRRRPRHAAYLICFWRFYARVLMSGQGQMEVIDINNIGRRKYDQFVCVSQTNATFLKFVYLSQQKRRKFAKLLNRVNNSVYFKQSTRKSHSAFSNKFLKGVTLKVDFKISKFHNTKVTRKYIIPQS